jgi:hypothetical protein
MKRFNGWLACLALTAVLLGTQTSEAGQKVKIHKSSEPPAPVVEVVPIEATAVSAATKESSVEQQVVQELIKIMDETKSPTTLLATTLALMPMGKKAQAAVPAILRNAERLKVLQPLKDMSSAKAENATVLLTAVMAIQMDLPMTKEMLGFPKGPLNVERNELPNAPLVPQGYGPTPLLPPQTPPALPVAPTMPRVSPACPSGPLPPPTCTPPVPSLTPAAPAVNPTIYQIIF